MASEPVKSYLVKSEQFLNESGCYNQESRTVYKKETPPLRFLVRREEDANLGWVISGNSAGENQSFHLMKDVKVKNGNQTWKWSKDPNKPKQSFIFVITKNASLCETNTESGEMGGVIGAAGELTKGQQYVSGSLEGSLVVKFRSQKIP